MISKSQGIDRYKVPVVGKNGKLNEMIERSALWSNVNMKFVGMRRGMDLPTRCYLESPPPPPPPKKEGEKTN